MSQAALVFPGQGSQYVGMGKWLLENYSEASEIFDEANETLGMDLRTLCLEGSLSELSRTMNAQPAILTVSTIAHRFYMNEIGIQPRFLAGHSLGEYSALVAAGSLSFDRALYLVRQRGLLMEEAAKDGIGIMVSVKGVSKEWIEQVCREIHSVEAPVVLSCYNTSKQYVVSAHRSSVPKLLDLLGRNKVSHIPLNVSGPFHSPLMQEAADKLSSVLRQCTFQNWSVPVISNFTGRPYTSPLVIADHLLLQMTSPVMWEQSIRFMGKQKVNLLIELGPGSVLRNMIKDIPVQIEAFSFDKEEDITRFKNDHMWIHKNKNFMNRCLAIAVSTPNQNEAEEDYEAGVVQPIRKLKEMHAVFEQDGGVLAKEQKSVACELVRCILQTKGLSESDVAGNMNELELSL